MFYLPISKLYSILAVANLLAHYLMVMLWTRLRLKENVALKWASKLLWGSIYFAVDGTNEPSMGNDWMKT